MDATRFIGRVGALAVALGIGAAMSTGTGIAWAEDAGGGADSNTGSGASGADSKDGDARPGPTRTGPLSAVADRIREDADKRAQIRKDVRDRIRAEVDDRNERRAEAVERIQREVDKARTRLDDSRTELRAKLKVSPRPAAPPSEPNGGPRRTADATEGRQSVPDAATAVPDLRAPDRPATVAVQVREVTERLAQRSADAVAAASVALPRISPAAEVSAAVAAVTATVSDAVEAPPLERTTVMSALLGAAGLAPLAGGSTPITPGPSPIALAMLAWTRRETTQQLTANEITVPAGQVAALIAADDVYDANPGQAPAPDVPGSLASGTDDLGLVTGGNPDSGPGGPTAHWFVAGTDLGIMWDSGYVDDATGNRIIFNLFGDTYSESGMAGDWRNNVLFQTIDTNLNDGLTWNAAVIHAGANPNNPGTPTWYSADDEEAAGAAQIITDPGLDGLFGRTYTLIPTAAIAVPDATAEGGYVQYATVMSVRTWDNPGSWTTNYSAIAYSTDGGKTWTIDPDTARSSGWLRSKTNYVPGDEHFQQNALVFGNPDDPDSWTAAEGDPDRERYVYVYGTPSGRQGSAYLARVPESQLRDLDSYQYWAGENSDGTGKWKTGDPSKAVPVIGASENDFLPRLYKFFDCFTFGLFSRILNGIWVGGLPTFGNVSELSVQYNEYAGRYLVTHTDGRNDVVLRVSDTPQGSWSDTVTLRPNSAGWYAPMIHPLSGTSDLGAGNEQYLYYNLSNWDQYNVHLYRTDISGLQAV